MWWNSEDPQYYSDSGSTKASLFDNSDIRYVKPHDGVVAGQPLWYELGVCGGVIQVVKADDVALIKRILKEFNRMIKNGTCDESERYTYLTYELKEEYGW